MPAPTDSAATRELIYRHASAALEQQQAVLEGLRTRAGMLLSAAALSTSFLGGRALGSRMLHVASWAAIICFLVVSVMSVAILWPHGSLDTTTRLPAIPAYARRSAASVHHALARYMDVAYSRNERQLGRIATYLRAGMIFFTLEVVWWVVDLATRA